LTNKAYFIFDGIQSLANYSVNKKIPEKYFFFCNCCRDYSTIDMGCLCSLI